MSKHKLSSAKLFLVATLAACVLGACGGGEQTTATADPSSGSGSGTGGSGSGGTGGTGGSGGGGSGTTTPTSPTDVVTFKNDVGRTGQNLTESVLTPTNVNSATFGLLHNLSVDGKVDAQPLYLSQLTAGTPPAIHNVVFVATEGDSVYAFDADTGKPVWQVNLLGSGETLSDTHSCGQVTPNIGITSTPVIDRAAGALYVVAMSKDKSSAYHQRLHALSLATGTELFNGPVEITATYPATAGGAASTFQPGQYEERAALLLSKGVVYTSWTSHCDIAPYGGWIIAYNQSTLAQTTVLNIAPNSGAGPAIWMAGDGPGADSAGNIYLLAANGAFETSLDANGFPSKRDFGNSFLKLSPSPTLAVADYFAMSNEVTESNADQDLGSGGEMLLPDLTDANNTVRHLVVGAGKDGTLYVVDRDSMGKFNANSNNIWQQLTNVFPGGVFSSPAYFNSVVYYADVGGTLKAFPITNARLGNASTAQSTTLFQYPGASPAVSANGTSNAIIWVHENMNLAVLHAYDATNLTHELYNSNQAANNRDHFGAGNKFITPTIADGKVFVGSQNSVAVFGLLH
jgi:hypothetical protein